MSDPRPHPEHPLIARGSLSVNRGTGSDPDIALAKDARLGTKSHAESRSMKYRLAAILPVHLAVFCFCYAAATALRFDFDVPAKFRQVYWSTLPLVLIIKFAACLATAEWRRTFRYVTVLDLVFVGAGTFGASICLLLGNLLLPEELVIPR